MHMHMIHHLMRNPSIILQDVIILCPLGSGYLRCYGEEFGEVVVRDVGQFGAVVLGDHEGVAGGEGVDVEEGEGFLRLDELHGGDFSCFHGGGGLMGGFRGEVLGRRVNAPLMTLQKMQLAAILSLDTGGIRERDTLMSWLGKLFWGVLVASGPADRDAASELRMVGSGITCTVTHHRRALPESFAPVPPSHHHPVATSVHGQRCAHPGQQHGAGSGWSAGFQDQRRGSALPTSPRLPED
jgi:hypothetical protein